MSLTMGTGPFGHEPWGVSSPELPRTEWRYLEPSPRRIRGIVGDEVVVDSGRPMLFFEYGQLPRYYFPREHVHTELLVPNGHTKSTEDKGTAHYFDLVVGDRREKKAGWTYQSDADLTPDLRPYVAFYWRARTWRHSLTRATHTTESKRYPAPGTSGSCSRVRCWPRPTGRW